MSSNETAKFHGEFSNSNIVNFAVHHNLTKSDHCHVAKDDLEELKKRNETSTRKLIIVMILCSFFMIGEIVGGFLANSISIQTDAAHLASDIVGFFLNIIAIFISENKPTRRMSFGFYRSEILGALISTLLIWVLTGVLLYLAFKRVIDQSFELEPISMLITASLGVFFNIVMYIVLHTNIVVGNIKHHSHETQLKEEDEPNINVRSAAIHVIGDFIQSLGVLIAAIIVYLKPEYKLADPICTFIFSFLVIITTAPIIRDIYFVLMEDFKALPVSINYDMVVKDLCQIENVKKAHNLHIWCLTMDKFALSVHLVTEKGVDTQIVLRDANELLRAKYNIDKTTIQVEYFKESMNDCEDCKLPE